MKSLVLGGNGFIGSHVVDHLKAAGHAVRVLDRAMERFRAPVPGVDYRLTDFSDATVLAEALEGIDVVFHLVSTTVPSTSNLDPLSDIQSNLVDSVRLLQLMVQQRVPKIVYLSSGGTVYGIPEVMPVPESYPLRPICSYGIVKAAIENYLHMFHHLYGLEYVVLRASNAYGERQGHMGVQGVIATFMFEILKGEPIEIWGDGSVVRDFIYVGDLAELCIRAAVSNVSGIFNAGSGQGYSINEVLDAIAIASGVSVTPQYKPGRAYDVPHVVLDISRAKKEFRWSPKGTFIECIKLTWEWFKKHFYNKS